MSVIKSIQFSYSEDNSPAFLRDADRSQLRPPDVGAIASAVEALGSGAHASAGQVLGVICLAAFNPDRLSADVRSVFETLSGWDSCDSQAKHDSALRISRYLVETWLSSGVAGDRG